MAEAESPVAYSSDAQLRIALRAGIPGITIEQEDAVLSYIRQSAEPELQAARCDAYASRFGLKAFADCTRGPGAD